MDLDKRIENFLFSLTGFSDQSDVDEFKSIVREIARTANNI